MIFEVTEIKLLLLKKKKSNLVYHVFVINILDSYTTRQEALIMPTEN